MLLTTRRVYHTLPYSSFMSRYFDALDNHGRQRHLRAVQKGQHPPAQSSASNSKLILRVIASRRPCNAMSKDHALIRDHHLGSLGANQSLSHILDKRFRLSAQ